MVGLCAGCDHSFALLGNGDVEIMCLEIEKVGAEGDDKVGRCNNRNAVDSHCEPSKSLVEWPRISRNVIRPVTTSTIMR